jgi:methionyl-tRNA synthetase
MSDHITIEDLSKIDLRVGRVIKAERHPDPKVKKLLVLTVDLGEPEPRTILAGIAEHNDPETVQGQNIIVVANLAPREMRGYTSRGMLLAAGPQSILTVTGDVAPGTKVG